MTVTETALMLDSIFIAMATMTAALAVNWLLVRFTQTRRNRELWEQTDREFEKLHEEMIRKGVIR